MQKGATSVDNLHGDSGHGTNRARQPPAVRAEGARAATEARALQARMLSVQALEEMTGQTFGEDVDKWEKWVRKHS